MGIRSKRRNRTPAIDPHTSSPSRRRQTLDSCRKDVFDDLPRSAERRDWAALPRDVLWVILSLLPQTEVLRGAGLACAPWRRLALDEPLLWRQIDLAAGNKKYAEGWQAMACTAMRLSAGRCESYRGRVDRDVLIFLAHSAPSLRSLHVTCRFDMTSEKFIAVVAKKLPMLEKVVLSNGLIKLASLVALVDNCPRLQSIDAAGCHTTRTLPSIGQTLRASLESRIKDLHAAARRPIDTRTAGDSTKICPAGPVVKINAAILHAQLVPYLLLVPHHPHSRSPTSPSPAPHITTVSARLLTGFVHRTKLKGRTVAPITIWAERFPFGRTMSSPPEAELGPRNPSTVSYTWRHIDLTADDDEGPPARWMLMAVAAVRGSAGCCESFRGCVNDNFLLFLAQRVPLLQSLHMTGTGRLNNTPSEKFITVMARKLHQLEELMLADSFINEALLAALVDHCPRLQLLDAGSCHTYSPIDSTLRARL
ncbi:hypothetical protein ACQ4PT_035361 [Festuca glaucescens]